MCAGTVKVSQLTPGGHTLKAGTLTFQEGWMLSQEFAVLVGSVIFNTIKKGKEIPSLTGPCTSCLNATDMNRAGIGRPWVL